MPPSWSWMAYTGGIDYLPIRDADSIGKTSVEFDYPKDNSRCVLVGPLWIIPMVTSRVQERKTSFNLNGADSANEPWVRYDNGRELDGKDLDFLDFIPILYLVSRFTYGLLVEKAKDQEYCRIGVASVRTRPEYEVSKRVTVI